MLSFLPGQLGPTLKFLIAGPGSDAEELARFFDLHIVVLPAVFVILLVLKMYMFEIHGAAELLRSRAARTEKVTGEQNQERQGGMRSKASLVHGAAEWTIHQHIENALGAQRVKQFEIEMRKRGFVVQALLPDEGNVLFRLLERKYRDFYPRGLITTERAIHCRLLHPKYAAPSKKPALRLAEIQK